MCRSSRKLLGGSGYERRPLIKEFKRESNRAIRRKLAKAKEPLTTIGEWQERAVRLDRNQRQRRAEERMLGRNIVCPGGNVQPREGYREGSYGRRGEQITWRVGGPSTGEGYRKGGENISNREENQLGPRRNSNAMDVDRGRGEDRTCYVCRR